MPEALSLATMESCYVGGTTRRVTHAWLGEDELVLDAMYVQRLVPSRKTFPYPVVFIHGGSHTGVTWETTPDRREGWQTLFVRGGFETLVIDQIGRGRSAPDLTAAVPYFEQPEGADVPAANMAGMTLAVRFTRGGNRFPLDCLHQYASQMCPDFTVPQAYALGLPGWSDPAAVAPIAELIDQIGPVVLITHSQGGHLGWRVAVERPDKVAAILAIEPGSTCPGLDDPAFPDIPVCVVWGDNLPPDGMSLTMRDVEQARAISAERPKVVIDLLPEHGIYGNGHMMMMEDNSAELAARGMDWLRSVISVPEIGAG